MQLFIKRLFDIVLSLILILLFIPLWLLIGIAIKVTSEGPVLFLQKRPGFKSEIFEIYKFRTMRTGSEKMIKGKEVSQDDDRITSIGKILRRTKLDETPQLINVLKGEMSLVGPRPERIDSLKDYDEKISKRLCMRPGMTGLAQVSGNIHIDLKDRYKLDVYYIEKYSLLLDLKILVRTIGVIIFGEEKYKHSSLVE